jgi:GTPase SAR1 family protein
LEKFSISKYKVTKEDVLCSTKKTTGITTFPLEVNSLKLKLIDSGGQKNERKKWKQCYTNESLNGILFLVSMSEFDQLNYEDGKTNRMMDSLNIFHSTANDPLLEKTKIFLIFNKMDLFEEKIKNSNQGLKDLFKDFKDDVNAKEFIKNKYLEKVENKNRILSFETISTDEKRIRELMDEIIQNC